MAKDLGRNGGYETWKIQDARVVGTHLYIKHDYEECQVSPSPQMHKTRKRVERIALLVAEPAPRNVGALASKRMEKCMVHSIANLSRFRLEHLAVTSSTVRSVRGGWTRGVAEVETILHVLCFKRQLYQEIRPVAQSARTSLVYLYALDQQGWHMSMGILPCLFVIRLSAPFCSK
mmetsp:Transcript_6260/g.38934  ORF Transcript_6260/g.38934 Transcript_6260/m.38934 type:complete len:175 (-) Transcript_6260:473-997(-)